MKLDEVLKSLDPLAKTLGVAVTELWKIFCRQYLVKGVSQLFSGIIFIIGAIFMGIYLVPISNWLIIAVIGVSIWSILFIHSSIPYLFNCSYYALDDLMDRIKGETKDDSRRYY